MSDWIEWSGGDRPHPPETEVEVRYRDGETDKGQSAFARWWHTAHPSPNDIIAYRVMTPSDTPASAAKGEARYGWQSDMASVPAAVTLIYKAAPDRDGCEHVWLGIGGQRHAVAWSYLPDVVLPHPSQQAVTKSMLDAAWEVAPAGTSMDEVERILSAALTSQQADPVPPEWTGQGTDADFFVAPDTEFSRASQQAGTEARARLLSDATEIRKWVADCADARTWGGPTIYPAHPIDEARASRMATDILAALTSEAKG